MGSIVNDILMWLTDLGYFGIAIGLMIEIIPSEIVLAYGGYMVSNGSITITGAVIAGVIGERLLNCFYTGSATTADGRFYTNTENTY